MNRSTIAFLLTLTVAAVGVMWVIHRVEKQAATHAAPMSWQDADVPSDAATLPDPWLEPTPAWLDAATPETREIGPAMATPDVALAVADGVVIFAGMRDGTHAVILGHRTADDVRFESIYGPLESTPALKVGDLIGRGMTIGPRPPGDPWPVLPHRPEGLADVEGGFSALATALQAEAPDGWTTLEIRNAERMLELENADDQSR